ncbi:MAG: UDP-N-acetylglucosamine 2-epimerase (non-hydrolyzing) [Pirellulales bacterium]
MSIACIAGARPNFMKIAPLVRAFAAGGLAPYIIHTGQHYDEKMSQSFFDDLEIPRPQANLEVGSGSHVFQIAEVMKRLEQEFQAQRPAAVVVVGDVNSTLAATITAVKMEIPVAHVEAGLRSFDRTMPEEINRVLTDSISHWLFTSEPSGEVNLGREGIPRERIHFVGNVMIDTLLTQLPRARAEKPYEGFDVTPRHYAVLTLHRPANVDDRDRLSEILRAVTVINRDLPVLFVMHPRTQARITDFGLAEDPQFNGYRSLEPVGYRTMLGLNEAARLVITDSGGIQEETTVLGVPCLTIRDNTERPITVQIGSNRLVKHDTQSILKAAEEALNAKGRSWSTPELWDGRASERIAAILSHDLR